METAAWCGTATVRNERGGVAALDAVEPAEVAADAPRPEGIERETRKDQARDLLRSAVAEIQGKAEADQTPAVLAMLVLLDDETPIAAAGR